MNPWKTNVLNACRDFLRFLLWFGLVLNVLMLAVFGTFVFYQFLTHAWDWMFRNWFSAPWGA